MGGKDNLAGKVNAKCKKKIFYSVNFRSKALLIYLNKNKKVLYTAGITFNIDSIIGFLTSLSITKRGIR